MEEARTEALLQTEGKTVTYVSPNSGSNDWVQFGKPKDKRSLNSVILRKDAKENIVSDAEEFIENSKWYRDREIPYRRGYLLHGPPGMYGNIPTYITSAVSQRTGWVRKMAIFADVQYCIYADIVGGWVRKSSKNMLT